MFQRIRTEGIAVFRRQPGFIRYRLMRADVRTTIAVAEWENEELGTAGATAPRLAGAGQYLRQAYHGDLRRRGDRSILSG